MSTTTKPSLDFWAGLFTPLIAAGALVLLSPLIILRAWVLTMLWGWYVVPAFGAEPLRLIFAFGILMIVMVFRGVRPKSDKTLGETVVDTIASSLLILLVGWAGSLFV